MRRGAKLQRRWLPKEQNEEADALSNGDCSSFQVANRIRVDPANFGDIIFTKMITAAAKLELELRQLKSKRPALDTPVAQRVAKTAKYSALHP